MLTMPRVSEEHREQMRQRILNAALACVARKGFSAVSMADIIAEAGLSAGAVYLYYRGKEQLTQDIARRVLEPRLAALDQVRNSDPIPPPTEVLPDLMQAVAATEYFPAIAVQVWGDIVHADGAITDFARAMVERLIAEATSYLADWLVAARGLPAEAATARAAELAPAMIGLAQGFVVQSALTKGEIDARYLDAVRALLSTL